jgi:excisionase family DNA binding protein
MKTSDLSIKELAAFIGVSTDTVRRAVRKREIPARRAKTALRFDLQEVRICMQSRASQDLTASILRMAYETSCTEKADQIGRPG